MNCPQLAFDLFGMIFLHIKAPVIPDSACSFLAVTCSRSNRWWHQVRFHSGSSPIFPCSYSSKALRISSFEFMTKGPWPTMGSLKGSPSMRRRRVSDWASKGMLVPVR